MTELEQRYLELLEKQEEETRLFLSKCFEDKTIETRKVRELITEHSAELNVKIIRFLQTVSRSRYR
jgi:hypothetical protein